MATRARAAPPSHGWGRGEPGNLIGTRFTNRASAAGGAGHHLGAKISALPGPWSKWETVVVAHLGPGGEECGGHLPVSGPPLTGEHGEQGGGQGCRRKASTESITAAFNPTPAPPRKRPSALGCGGHGGQSGGQTWACLSLPGSPDYSERPPSLQGKDL